MSSSNQLSFLPDDYMELKVQRRTNVLWAIVFIIVAAGIAGAYWVSQKNVAEAERVNQDAIRDFTAAAKPIEQFKELQTKQQIFNRQANLAASLIDRVQRSNILAQLTNLLPQGVSLMDFNLQGKRRETVARGMTALERARAASAKSGDALNLPEPIQYDIEMKIKGVAYNDQQVSDYITNLNNSPFFKTVNLNYTEEFADKESKMRQFEIVFTLNPDVDPKSATSRSVNELEKSK